MTFHKISHILVAVLASAMMLCCGSCSSKKNVASGRPERTVAAKRTKQAADLAATYSPWTTFYAPMSLNLSKPVSFSCSGRATMEYGKYIHLSLRFLGIEAGVVYVDSDSAFVVDKYHRVAVAAPIAALTSRTSLTLEDLQGILLGQAVYPGEGIIYDSKRVEQLFSASTTDDGSILTPRRTPAGSTWYFTLDPSPALRSLNVEIDGSGTINAIFSSLAETPAGIVASEVDVTGTFGKYTAEMGITWNLGRAEWNGQRSASRPNINGYKLLTPADLLKGLK